MELGEPENKNPFPVPGPWPSSPALQSLPRPGLRALQVVGEAQGPVVLWTGAAGQDPGAWSRAEAGVRGADKLGILGSAESQA